MLVPGNPGKKYCVESAFREETVTFSALSRVLAAGRDKLRRPTTCAYVSCTDVAWVVSAKLIETYLHYSGRRLYLPGQRYYLLWGTLVLGASISDVLIVQEAISVRACVARTSAVTRRVTSTRKTRRQSGLHRAGVRGERQAGYARSPASRSCGRA